MEVVGSRDERRAWGGSLFHLGCSLHPSGDGAERTGGLAGLCEAGAWWCSNQRSTHQDLSLQAKQNLAELFITTVNNTST